MPFQAVRINGPGSGRQHGVLGLFVGKLNAHIMFRQVRQPVARMPLQDLFPGADILSDPPVNRGNHSILTAGDQRPIGKSVLIRIRPSIFDHFRFLLSEVVPSSPCPQGLSTAKTLEITAFLPLLRTSGRKIPLRAKYACSRVCRTGSISI